MVVQERAEKGILPWETPVEFSEDFKWDRYITFTASSYKKWIDSVLPQYSHLPIVDNYKQVIKLSDNKYFYMREFPLWVESYVFWRKETVRAKLDIYKGHQEGKISFDDVVGIPVLCDGNGNVWMSITPNEILTLRNSIRRSKGKVGIAGLGLGLSVRRILDRKQVEKVTVVEIDKDVIKYFGEPLLEEFGDKLNIVNGDAYEYDWKQFDGSVWDIWKDFADASMDRKFQKIKNNIFQVGKYCVGWGVGSNSKSK